MNNPIVKTEKKQRNSNLELFRILSMFLIIAHHYVVNSGLLLPGGPMSTAPMAWRTLFLMVFGGWGKLGINCFVLITGYFMCTSKITAKKFAKLLFEIMFYKIVIFGVFAAVGYTPFSVKGLVKAILPFTSLRQNFPGCFIMFYLLIPFINVAIQSMTEKQHLRLILLLIFTYVILGTAFGNNVVFNYITWFIVIYVVAAYIRLYPKAIFDKTKLWGILSVLALIGTAASIIVLHYLGIKMGKPFGDLFGYTLLVDSNRIVSFVTALCFFMFFKNVKIGYSKFINTAAASAFGVLLIHSGGDAMRKFVWVDLLKVTQMYDSSLLIVHALGCVVGIYAVCAVLDFLRIHLIETPFFKLWDKVWPKVVTKWETVEEKICKKCNISEK